MCHLSIVSFGAGGAESRSSHQNCRGNVRGDAKCGSRSTGDGRVSQGQGTLNAPQPATRQQRGEAANGGVVRRGCGVREPASGGPVEALSSSTGKAAVVSFVFSLLAIARNEQRKESR
jgi:hypothetical protein